VVCSVSEVLSVLENAILGGMSWTRRWIGKFFVWAVFSVVSMQHSGAAVMDKSKSFVSQLLELGQLSRATQGALSPESRKLIEGLSSQVDFESLASKSLGATRWKQIDSATRQDFLKTLQETIETVLYPRADRITTSLNEVRFEANPKAARNVVARTKFETEKQGEIVERDLEFELIFDAREKVVDAIIEGELVSANLKRQFDQALQKRSFEQILAQMKKRLADAQSKQTRTPPSEKVEG
jgi:ABC-type transporter MlaC component